MAKTNGLTDKQQRFTNEYPKDFNATQAAIRAGYSPKGAGVMACRLLKNPRVSEEIAKRMGDIVEKTDVEVGEIVAALRKIAFGGKKATNSEQLKALDLLGRFKAMYTDRVQEEQASLEVRLTYEEWQQRNDRRRSLEARAAAIDATAGIAG